MTRIRIRSSLTLLMLRRGLPPMTVFLKNEYGKEKTDQEIDDAALTNLKKHQTLTQSALEFCPIHCPNGRLGQGLGFGGIAFALKLPELLNINLAAVSAKLGQRSCFPNGPQIWCPIGQ